MIIVTYYCHSNSVYIATQMYDDLTIKLQSSDYDSKASHFGYPLKSNEYLVSERTGRLRTLKYNKNPVNDDERF